MKVLAGLTIKRKFLETLERGLWADCPDPTLGEQACEVHIIPWTPPRPRSPASLPFGSKSLGQGVSIWAAPSSLLEEVAVRGPGVLRAANLAPHFSSIPVSSALPLGSRQGGAQPEGQG